MLAAYTNFDVHQMKRGNYTPKFGSVPPSPNKKKCANFCPKCARLSYPPKWFCLFLNSIIGGFTLRTLYVGRQNQTPWRGGIYIGGLIFGVFNSLVESQDFVISL